MSAGANHSVCAVASGLVFGWGHAEYNQQGVAGMTNINKYMSTWREHSGEGGGWGGLSMCNISLGFLSSLVMLLPAIFQTAFFLFIPYLLRDLRTLLSSIAKETTLTSVPFRPGD